MKIENIEVGKMYYVREAQGTGIVVAICVAISDVEEIVMWRKYVEPCDKKPRYFLTESQNVIAPTITIGSESEECKPTTPLTPPAKRSWWQRFWGI